MFDARQVLKRAYALLRDAVVPIDAVVDAIAPSVATTPYVRRPFVTPRPTASTIEVRA